MRKLSICFLCCICISTASFGQAAKAKPLFLSDMSNADYSKDVWSIDKDGVLTATKDQSIWTTQEYENFELTLEFKMDHCTNSGVIIYSTDKNNWIPNSVEIQIADDYCEKFEEWPKDWMCGALFGHLAPTKTKIVKEPGKWNKMIIIAKGQHILVKLNGKKVADMDMKRWTDGSINPDGTSIPKWLPKPFAELPTKGYIGFQGKHGEATIWFKNIKIKQI
ncbi:MAG: hypothetical protein EZS26_003671 [Candidatus Ordinivivax streblomastigis]|uniref:3-keto-alpha-glucoside-1,2-lyase/3-keto-2-hydroxy-glucal hydratase domain-containing protein n=1 Tax=Candidatus Ordinivivax streblomastigis TaxID=2540710 RepID=A0A5M8NY31_9BACT|nr:MAG: hypothetical protein EZS26_003671 [Candidatus Ordinivivax streblomastigis]